MACYHCCAFVCPPSSSSSSSSSSLLLLRTPHKKTSKILRYKRPKFLPLSLSSALSDPFVLQLAENLEDSLSSPSPPPLQKLRQTSSQSLLSKSWPSPKDELFRFTDTSFLKSCQILPISIPPPSSSFSTSPQHIQFPSLTILDGFVAPSPSQFSSRLPHSLFVGAISDLPTHLSSTILNALPTFTNGDLFWDLNGIGAPDVAVVFVPAGCRVDTPLHLNFSSSQGADGDETKLLPVSNPRALVVVEEGAEIDIIEEYSGSDDKRYWANSVMEIVIGEGAKVRHSYIQTQSSNAAHMKWTFVQQASSSSYELIETSTGGKLSRHNLQIQQLGSDTLTELSTFHLCGSNQTQDLHSRIVLDHPRGYSRQLHKCIVTHSTGHAVFDGNIKVNRFAQQTDAGQLTRSLLLVPRATVNVKPNLQIIADDVKCSHGAAISDLEEEQLFYFQTRGVDIQTARNALIFSFGAEVTNRLPYQHLRMYVENHIRGLLAAKGAFQ